MKGAPQGNCTYACSGLLGSEARARESGSREEGTDTENVSTETTGHKKGLEERSTKAFIVLIVDIVLPLKGDNRACDVIPLLADLKWNNWLKLSSEHMPIVVRSVPTIEVELKREAHHVRDRVCESACGLMFNAALVVGGFRLSR
jgi:hypothetical protein